MSSAKRTSLKDRKSPLDELFRPTGTVGENAGILRDKEREKGKEKLGQDALEMLTEDIKLKRRKELAETKKKREVLKKEREKIKKQKKKGVRQTTLILYGYQFDWLDMKRIEARTKGGSPISNAKLVRALIDLGISSPIDLGGVKNEEEVVKRLEEGIKLK